MMIRPRKAGYSGNQTTTEPNASKGLSIPCCEPNLIRPYFAIKSVRFSIFQETLGGVRTTIGYTAVTTKHFCFYAAQTRAAIQAKGRGNQYPRHQTFQFTGRRKKAGISKLSRCGSASVRFVVSFPAATARSSA